MRLSNGIVVHPDFTVLRMKDRKILYWEHLGMMDDSEYMRNAVRKIESYEESGLYPGKDLILSHETIRKPLNTKMIEKIVEKYILI